MFSHINPSNYSQQLEDKKNDIAHLFSNYDLPNLDVFESEPPQRVEMLNHPGVTMSSHIGGFTTESVDRATMMAVQNILGCLDGPFV